MLSQGLISVKFFATSSGQGSEIYDSKLFDDARFSACKGLWYVTCMRISAVVQASLVEIQKETILLWQAFDKTVEWRFQLSYRHPRLRHRSTLFCQQRPSVCKLLRRISAVVKASWVEIEKDAILKSQMSGTAVVWGLQSSCRQSSMRGRSEFFC